MLTPTNHHMTITDLRGRQVRSTVIYLQPKAERSLVDRAVVHVTASEWLDSYTYRAIYITPTQSTSGTYSVGGYATADDLWVFKGTFTRAQDDSTQLS